MNESKYTTQVSEFGPSEHAERASLLELESLAKSTLDEAALQILAFTKKVGEVVRKNPVATAAIVAVVGYALFRVVRAEPKKPSEALHH